ncbi:TetR/AcrR family transcriptional regulator [Paenibacillus whitsoniae]|uniref:TetR/AcrR family transcriptional regulator n=1 Tax=Paenibacillus whitsoniae TaxID=2496558 RepID=A0A3S0IB60_9BACL|nr:TetR/AcrR family transcriptional regulator [Paenibacillus whitsoniae]RTE09136.1 TetR/AcrR family transcriptional regulator [Paenibacillus whitsoniae]
MTAARIKEVALKYFANHGYEGASLADIAEEVGIKKQSIYTHFKGKDELFLALLYDALAKELSFVTSYLDRNKARSVEALLYGFLNEYQICYETNDNTKFYLRTAFFPPAHLYEEIVKEGYRYLDTVEALLVTVFDQAKASASIHAGVGSEAAAAAFLSVLDGIFVELLFGGSERATKRLEASWLVYWRGIRQ